MGSFKLLLVGTFFTLLGGAVVAADFHFVTDESDSIYGKGVHAFFDRDYEEAVAILSKAEEIKNNDPRPYYFLGLAHLRQKKSELAEQYFKKAAQLEFDGLSLRDYAVSESLRRIQGEERLRIEKIRSEERGNAQIREQQIRAMRYGSKNSVARENLRQTMPLHQHINQNNADIAALQESMEDWGENAFGVKPIDAGNASKENIVPRRTDTNPFGEVTVNITAEKKIPEVSVPRKQEPVAPQPRRTYVNPDVVVEPQKPVQSQTAATAASMNPVQNVQSATAKELGKALGTLFSGKASTE